MGVTYIYNKVKKPLSLAICYGVESVPKITGLRGPPAFRRSPTFLRPHGFRVLDIPHLDALSVPKSRGPPTFHRSHSFHRPHSFGRPHSDLFLFPRLIGCLMYNCKQMPSIIKSGPGFSSKGGSIGESIRILVRGLVWCSSMCSKTSLLKSYNPDYWYNKIVNMHFEILISLSTYIK